MSLQANIDIKACQHSDGTVKIIVCIEDPSVIKNILEYLEPMEYPANPSFLRSHSY